MDQNDRLISRLTVTNPAAARALYDAGQRRLLTPFFQAAQSIGDAAKACDAYPSTVQKFVGRMLNFGILQADGIVIRSGRRVPSYRPAAREFFIPLPVAESAAFRSVRELHETLQCAFEEALLHRHHYVEPIGALMVCDSNGMLTLDVGLQSGRIIPGNKIPEMIAELGAVSLQPSDAIQIRGELAALVHRIRLLPPGEEKIHYALYVTSVSKRY